MPTYDYRCSTCGVDFELNQSFTEATLSKCPTKKSGRSPAGCVSPGRGRVEKVFSAPGITFKGSGFYKTDSRSSSSESGNGTKKAPTKESTSTTTSTSTSETTSSGSDSKAAASSGTSGDSSSS